MGKRGWALVFALCCLMAVCRAENSGLEEQWPMILDALASDESLPVPAEYRISVRPGEMLRGGKAEEGYLNLIVCSTDVENLKENYGRADAILVCRVNLETGESRLLSMPYSGMAALDELPEPIYLRYVNCFGGPRLTARVLNDALGTRVDRYLSLNIDAFMAIVDALGGVDMTLTEDEAEALEMKAGKQALTGEQALSYIRLRRGGDTAARMRALMEAMLRQLFSLSSTNQAFALVDAVMSASDTNLTTDDVIDLVFAVLGQEQKSAFETKALLLENGVFDDAARQQAQDFLYGRE